STNEGYLDETIDPGRQRRLMRDGMKSRIVGLKKPKLPSPGGDAVTDNIAKLPQKAAVIYGRVSSEDQDLGYSLEAHLKACREWASTNGYMIHREYIEEGHSAFRNLDKLEAFRELLSVAASKPPPFDLIILHKLDRLFRDSLEPSSTRAILKRERVRLV